MRWTVSFFAVMGLGLLACNADRSAMSTLGHMLIDAGDDGRADAQSTAPSGVARECLRWSVSFYTAGAQPNCENIPSVVDGQSCEIPTGWEPFAGEDRVSLRKCLEWSTR